MMKKGSQFFPKVVQKVETTVLLKSNALQNSPKSHHIGILVVFVREFGTKTFQK